MVQRLPQHVVLRIIASGLISAAAYAMPAMAGPMATSITLETAAGVADLTSGATYGPPAPATFPDGPFIVSSGTSVPLAGGPGSPAGTKKHPISVDTVLLVLSSTEIADLGSHSITLTFDSLPSVEILSGDFFTTTDGGFPNSIKGIALGQVNNISFPTAEHAAVDIAFNEGIANGDSLGNVTIVSPIDLRVDVFGDAHGTLIGNAANSGAEGVNACTDGCGNTPVPEPEEMTLLATALLALGMVKFRYRQLRA